ncbi:low-specificity L-threonine aldolase [candidate division KSB1 bacterium]|nr:low-specificity L-threonine aldolase [candidate division KSB1 bacterium]
MKYFDFRSDTVTVPSIEMRKAMADAEVGDDVFGDDPTMNALQERVAKMTGKEAALFVASGTMANVCAIMAHTRPGDEVIVEREGHTFVYEVAAPAVLGGIQLNPLPGDHGILEVGQIEQAIRPDDVHQPPTRLIVLENTHNRGGGKIYPFDNIQAIAEFARGKNINMHLDGARLFNASVATGIPIKDYASQFDSIMFCFSKGLGAPIGSIIAGSREFIRRAHRIRKMLGGGMRQVGILAAAANYSLDHNIERLADDHVNAKRLAFGLAQIKGFTIDPNTVDTNIVVIDVSASQYSVSEIVSKFKEQNVLVVPFGRTFIRAVTHLNVSTDDVDQTIRIARQIFG